jgi:hypothetical protein
MDSRIGGSEEAWRDGGIVWVHGAAPATVRPQAASDISRRQDWRMIGEAGERLNWVAEICHPPQRAALVIQVNFCFRRQTCRRFSLSLRAKLVGERQTVFEGVDGDQQTSAIDHVHKISSWIAEKETAKAPRLLDGSVNDCGICRANGSLGGVEILHAN